MYKNFANIVSGRVVVCMLLAVMTVSSGCREPSTSKATPRKGKATASADNQLASTEVDDQNAPAYTHADHFAIVKIDVSRIVEQKELKQFDWNVIFQTLTEPLGGLVSTPLDLAEVILLLDQTHFSLIPNMDPESKDPHSLVIVLIAKETFAIDKLSDKFVVVEGNSSLYLDEERNQQLWFVDDSTIVIGSPEPISKLAGEHRRNASILNSVRLNSQSAISGNLEISPVRNSIKTALSPFAALAPEVAQVISIVNSLQRVDFAVDLKANRLGHSSFVLSDSKSAGELKEKIAVGAQTMAGSFGQVPSMPSELQDEMLTVPTQTRVWSKVMNEISRNGMTVTQEQNVINVTVDRPASFDELLSAMVNDATNQLESAVRIGNIKAVADAIKVFESENGYVPAAEWKPKDETNPFSWRVALLPYLDQQELYDQFNFDESWDSEHNMSVAKSIPDFFKSRVELIGGPSGVFQGDQNVKLDQVTDKLDQTALMVEVPNDIQEYIGHWHKPSVLEFDNNGDLPSMGRANENGIQAIMFDFSVRLLDPKSESGLRAVLTYNASDRPGIRVFKK